MKDDPFGTLRGLDQLLFTDDKPTRKQVNKPAGLSPDFERSKPGELKASPDATKQGAQPASIEESRPTGTPIGARKRVVRTTGRFTYDIYHDQARWMNRLKIDLEEAYGAKPTINSMVVLAVDALIADYELNGEQSQIIRVLVSGLALQTTHHAPQEAQHG